MPHYKDPQNNIHYLDDEAFENLLPDGCIEIDPSEVPSGFSKEDRIVALQAAYEIDLEKLNKAWLAALIADGANEAARQAAIKTQMLDLADQLDLDILTIIMEE